MKIVKSKDAYVCWCKYTEYELKAMSAYAHYRANPSSENEEAWDNAQMALYDLMDCIIDNLRS